MISYIKQYKKTLLTAVLFILLCACCSAALIWAVLEAIQR